VPLAGLSVLKILPDFALHHFPLIKSPNLDLCSLSQSSAKAGFSGAGLYSIVSNISIIFIYFLCYYKKYVAQFCDRMQSNIRSESLQWNEKISTDLILARASFIN
jgi:hypothetical protein